MKYFRFKYLIMLFRLLFFKLKFYNCLLLSSAKIGIEDGTIIIIKDNSKILLGDFIYLSRLGNLEAYDGGVINIGDRVSINKGFSIVARSSIKIGSNVMIGPNFMAYDHNHNFMSGNLSFNQQGFTSSGIEIGSNVWIGANVFVSSGINIGSNSVIAAGSVVTKDIIEGALYAGSPAKFIKFI